MVDIYYFTLHTFYENPRQIQDKIKKDIPIEEFERLLHMVNTLIDQEGLKTITAITFVKQQREAMKIFETFREYIFGYRKQLDESANSIDLQNTYKRVYSQR